MCGIIGCVLEEGKVAPLLRAALKRLEYRGYDSVGEATVHNGKLYIKKDAGKLDDVHARLNLDELPGRVGIGHTRWATHGAPSMVNAHPHTDCAETVAVVMNGIIENYAELREELTRTDHLYRSRCDAEVIPHLIEKYAVNGATLIDAVLKTLKELKGAYAIAVISEREPDKIICAAKEAPLVIGIGERAIYCASDIPAFLPMTNKVIFLEDGEVAILTLAGPKILKADTGEEVHRNVVEIPWSTTQAEKSGYAHFMLKEIHEQPLALRNVLRTREIYYDLMTTILNDAKNVFLVAAGTSYHSCVAASYMFSQLAHLVTLPVVASEFIENYGNIIDDRTVVLAVSQSGETADVLNPVRFAKSKGAKIVGITNVMGSSLTRLCNVYIGQNSGPEIGVCATKTFIAQLMVFAKLAINLALKRGHLSKEDADHLLAKLLSMPNMIQDILDKTESVTQKLAEKYKDSRCMCFLGRGINYATALEGRLKLLEVSYIPSLAYPAGESKHGFIALVEKNYPVIFVAPRDQTYDKTISNIMEMKARGANIISIIEDKDEQVRKLSDEYIEIPSDIPAPFLPIACVVPLQLLAYYTAVYRSLDPDMPRNLAKSVTVL